MSRQQLNGLRIASVAALPTAAANAGVLLRLAGDDRLYYSDGISWSDVAAAGGGGGTTVTRVIVDFGAVPKSAVIADIAVPGVAAGQKVCASLSLDMPPGVDPDEIEMDPLTVAAHAVAADTVRLLIASQHPVTGQRAVNILR